MAVHRLKYSQKLEQEIAKGTKLKEAQARATKYATIKKITKKKNWVSKLKRNVQMIIKGPKYYEHIKGKHSKRGKK